MARSAIEALGLTNMHEQGIFMHMRTTINIDDDLIAEAGRLTHIREKTALVRAGLEALIAREAARRLAALGGTDGRAKAGQRRRPSAARSRRAA